VEFRERGEIWDSGEEHRGVQGKEKSLKRTGKQRGQWYDTVRYSTVLYKYTNCNKHFTIPTPNPLLSSSPLPPLINFLL
jgi:hypothetical protein